MINTIKTGIRLSVPQMPEVPPECEQRTRIRQGVLN